MKVILAAKSVYPFHPVGGVQKYVYYFAKHLKAKGVDLEIVAPLDKGKPRVEDYEGLKYVFLKPSIYKYLEYPIGWFGVHRFSSSLAKYLKDKDFDVLHGFDMTAYQYSKTKNHKPIIAHIFTDNYLTNPISSASAKELTNLTTASHDRIKQEKVLLSPSSPKEEKVRYWLQYLFKAKPIYKTLLNSSRVFYEAEEMKKVVSNAYDINSEKGDVVPVGVDVAYVDKLCNESAVSREDFGINKEDIVLITVNRLAADKGIDKIILSLEQIAKEKKNIKLVIVGSGYQEEELYKLIEEKNLGEYIKHFKNVPEKELYQYYKLSDIYISAFSYPGSSVSTLEAMAAGLPVITTAQPWLVTDKNGILLENNQSETIAGAVLNMINKGCLKQMGESSKELVQLFDWEKIAEKAVSVYEKISK